MLPVYKQLGIKAMLLMHVSDF